MSYFETIFAKIDEETSTTEVLEANATYEGPAVLVEEWNAFYISVHSDVDGATDGIQIQSSSNGTDWDHEHTYTYNTASDQHYEDSLVNKYYRILYTNGGTIQTEFDLSVKLLKTAATPHNHPLNYVLDDNHGAAIVRAIQAGQKPNGDYINAGYTAGGIPKTSIEEYDDTVNPVRKDLIGMGDLTVGLAEVEVTFTGATFWVRIQADPTNTGIIFLGITGVLADGSNDLVRLWPGDEIIFQYDDATNALYAISDTAAQKLNRGALL